MAKKKNADFCCASCRVESVASVDGRGQMVLPKEVREKAGIKPGDKLAVITLERGKPPAGGKGSCCVILVKSDDLEGMVKEFLGPMAGAGK